MTIKKILSAFLLMTIMTVLVFSVGSIALAQTGTGGQSGTGTGGQESGLQNPIKVDSIGEFFYMLANFAYSLSYAVIAFFLIWSGFKFIVAQGNEEKLTDAKNTLKYTIIGAILLIGANVITEVVRTVINQFSNTQV